MRILTALIILLSVGVAHAAPTITGVSGTLSTGQTISIGGSSFGTHTMQVESLQNYIEAGTTGQTFTKTNWTQSDWTWASPMYATDASHSGNKSLKCTVNSNDYNCAFARILPNPVLAGQRLYVSYWVKYDGSKEYGGQWKMLKFKQEETIVDGPMDWGMGTWFDYQRLAGGGNSANEEYVLWPGVDTFPQNDNKWSRMEVDFTPNTLGQSNGTFTIRRTTDTGLIYEESTRDGFNSHLNAEDHFKYIIWQNYIGNGFTSATIHLDDLYVQTGTVARVELCSGSTWANRGKCEVQVPTAWNGTAITATANTGNFANASNAYLYVVDNDGGVSPAYGPLTINSSGGGDPPDPPDQPDTTNPSVTISTQAQTISGTTLTVTGSASDNDAVSSCRWQLGSVPTINTGSTCTGTTSFSCATSGYAVGSNTVHVACFDPSGNRGSDSVVITRAAADTTPPTVTITTAPHTVSGSTTTIGGNATDNVGVTSCRWRRNTVPTAATGTACTGTNPFSCSITGLPTGTSTMHVMHVACFDAANNRGKDSVVVTMGTVDTTPPVLSGGQPSGTLPAGTTSTTVSLTTDEDATCRWMPTSGTPYASMTNTFATTGARAHSMTAGGLSDGQTYRRYVRCIDGSGNANTSDYHISWSVASLPVDVISIGTVPIPYVSD